MRWQAGAKCGGVGEGAAGVWGLGWVAAVGRGGVMDWGTVVGVVVGAAASLGGTALADWLQYRGQRKERRRERRAGRYEEVRRVLISAVGLADLMSVPEKVELMGEGAFGEREFKDWAGRMSAQVDEWGRLEATWAPELFVRDPELLQLLRRIAVLKGFFGLSYLQLRRTGGMVGVEDECEEMRRLAARAQNRMDELVEKHC